MIKAVVLLSGGLDSSTTLFYAKKQGYICNALIFDYGQRHKKEIKSAVLVAKAAKVPYSIVKINLPWKGSALLDRSIKVPSHRSMKQIGKGIPSTYVPARNTIFLSYALSFAETIGAGAIFIGANIVDYSGYPDCRPKYFSVFQDLIKTGAKYNKIKIMTPLIKMTKSQIIKLAIKLGVPVDRTWSCYAGGKSPCGVCDSCLIRDKALKEVGIK